MFSLFFFPFFSTCGVYIDKTIKLWKVFEKSLKLVAESNGIASNGGGGGHMNGGSPTPTTTSSSNNNNSNALRIPKLMHHDTIIAAVPRRVYANGMSNCWVGMSRERD